MRAPRVPLRSGALARYRGISVWSIELAPKGREAKTIKNFQLCYALGGFIFTFLPGFLAEAFGTYLVTYVILLAMIAFAAVVVVGVYLWETVGFLIAYVRNTQRSHGKERQ